MRQARHHQGSRKTAGARSTKGESQASRFSGIELLRGLRVLLIALLVGLAVTAVHWPVLESQAVHLDDTAYLFRSELLQNPSWDSAGRLLTEVLRPSSVNGYYEPLTQISLMLDVAGGGREGNLRPFHRTSLALHAANTALLVVLLYLLFRRLWPAALAGLLFGVHPLTVESVAWVWERKTPLATLFVLISILLYLAYVRRGRLGWYVASIAVFVPALLSKPSSVPLPALLLILDYWPLRRLGRRTLLEKLPYVVLSAASAAITIFSVKTTAELTPPAGDRLGQDSLRACYALAFYLKKLVWPVDLSSAYMPPDPVSLGNPVMVSALIAVLVAAVLVVLSGLRTRAVIAAALFFLAAISPTLGFVGYSWVWTADKYVYLPVIGIVMALTCGMVWLWSGQAEAAGPGAATRRPSGQPSGWNAGATPVRIALLAAVGLLFALEATGTRRYLAQWRDSKTLIRHMLTLAPEPRSATTQPALYHPKSNNEQTAIARLCNEMGTVLQQEGRSAEALPYLEKAVRFYPAYVLGHYNLGLVLFHLQRLQEAEAHFRMVVALDSKFADAFNNLGACLDATGRKDEALGAFTQALLLNPKNAEAHYNVARALLAKGQWERAAAHYREALRLQPGFEAARLGLEYATQQVNASQPSGGS